MPADGRLTTKADLAGVKQHIQLAEGKTLTLGSGSLARQASGACLASQGGTQVLAAAVCEPPPFDRVPRASLTNPFRVSNLAFGATCMLEKHVTTFR